MAVVVKQIGQRVAAQMWQIIVGKILVEALSLCKCKTEDYLNLSLTTNYKL